MEEFYFYIALSFVISIASGICSSLTIWQKVSTVGDSFSHFLSLFMVSAVIFNLDTDLSLIVGLVCFICLSSLFEGRDLNNNFIVVSSIGLATSTILSSLYPNIRVDFMSLLFGDIVAANYNDLYKLLAFDVILLSFIVATKQKLKLYFINPSIAKSSGMNTEFFALLINLSIMIFILIMIQIVGTIMMIGLIVFPAVIARNFVKSAEKMILLSSINSFISTLAGLTFSFHFDSPAGPSIIISLAIMLSIVKITEKYKKKYDSKFRMDFPQ